ncbi:MAG: hypothetical protein DRO14_05680 [Thermoprotei archaeon]|nr:MAG: hypothetical protein DRO14_05680 [Thermoprotei archaeon]
MYRVYFFNTQIDVINRFQHFVKLMGLYPSKVYPRKDDKGNLWFEIYFSSKEMTLILNDMKQRPKLPKNIW